MTLRLNGSTSGYTEIDAPAVAGSNTLVLPTGAGSAYQVVRNGATAGSLEFTDKIVSETAKAWNWNGLTTNTSIDFTGIPSWVKRVTVMFSGVSTNGTSNWLVQLGDAGGIEDTGYVSGSTAATTAVALSTSTSGFILRFAGAAQLANGAARLNLLSTNLFVGEGTFYDASGTQGIVTLSGSKTLSDTLTQIRITTVNGTDRFDAGSINILYE